MRLANWLRKNSFGLAAMVLLTGLLAVVQPPAAKAFTPAPSIAGIVYNQTYRYNSSTSHYMAGDTFGTAWSDDNNVYLTVCDAPYSWNGSGASQDLSVNLLPDDPQTQQASQVNQMSFLGTDADVTGGDPGGLTAAWKGGSIISVGGTLYLEVNRQQYAWQSDNPLAPQYQRSLSASIMYSTDHGLTWYNEAGEENTAPDVTNMMFTSAKFNSFYFIQNGQDDSDGQSYDNSNTYVYAIGTGVWPDGTLSNGLGGWATVGRVPRDEIMDRADWTFYDGPTPTTGLEGLNSSNWTADADDATYVLTQDQQINWAQVTYDTDLQKYIFADYYYPFGYSNDNDPNRYFTTYQFYQADYPWGPWSPITSNQNMVGYYIPTIDQKASYETSGVEHVSILAAGPYASNYADWQNGTYTMYVQEADIYTSASAMPYLVDDSTTGTGSFEINYSSGWNSEQRLQAYEGGDHWSDTAGATASMTFTGTQFVLRGEEGPDKGQFGVSVDGGAQTVVDAYQPNVTDTAALYTSPTLGAGTHTVTVTVLGTHDSSSTGAYVNLDRIDIFGSGRTGSSSEVRPSDQYELVNESSGQALSIDGTEPDTNGATLLQWPFNDWPNQEFTFASTSGGAYEISNVGSGLPLNVDGTAPNAAGSNIIQWGPYNGWPNQQWYLYDRGGGSFELVSTGSGQAITVNSSGDVVQEPYSASADQLWSLVDLS